LPVSDLGHGDQVFWKLVAGDKPAGFVGIERYGQAALLRSLVVAPEAKGKGYGSALVRFAAEQASGTDVSELWLLTNTAAPFFAHLGWRLRARSDAPQNVQASAEFAGLCPSSAICMSWKTGI
jgi:amino-acid N-acetyltransferase